VTGPPTVPYSTPPPAAPASEPDNRPRALVIAAIVGVLAIAGVVAFLLTRDGDDDTPSNIPAATEEPTGLGDDEGFNALAEDCYDGDMQACDDLYNRAEDDSAYRRYGDTCAGRQPAGTRQFCVVTFPSD
jgi:hypothetical protein